MLDKKQKEILHLYWLIGYSFIFSSVAYMLSFLFLPDVSTDPPVISDPYMTLMKIQTVLLILASTTYGIKLSEEKKTLASAGFTMLAFSQGVLYIITTFTFNSNEKLEEAYRMLSACLYLQIPAIIIISFYHGFPRLLNITAVVSMIPFIIEYLAFMSTGRMSNPILAIDAVGNILMNTVVAAWGVIILKGAKQEIQKHST